MPQFRLKSATYAAQFLDDGESISAISGLVGGDLRVSYAKPNAPILKIGHLKARVGDWVVFDASGHWICSPEVFAEQYELVEEAATA